MTVSYPATQMDSFPLQGGLNLVTPPLSMTPGTCRDAQNYEIGIDGGYRRLDGYCRYHSTALPTDQPYHVIPCQISDFYSFSLGKLLTGSSSGATARLIASGNTGFGQAYLVVTELSGSFSTSEAITSSGGAITEAVSTGATIQDGAPTPKLHGEYKELTAKWFSSLIQAVPGSGSILGVVMFQGSVYAFRNAVGGATAAMYKSNGASWTLVTTPALQPNGSYSFQEYNFGSGVKLYGCDGVNKAFQFDGTTFTQITTGMTVDTPQCISAHKNHLFLAFGNSLQHSAIGNPLSWTPVLGAGEINMGDTITNLKPQTGSDSTGAMAVYSRNSTRVLYGTSSANWNLVILDPDAGALPKTAQHIGETVVVDDRGITTLSTTQNYGNFAAASVSAAVRPLILQNKGRVVGTTLCRDKNQYRVFFNNGRALYYTVGKGYMPMAFPHSFTAFYSGEDTSGNEVMLAGDSSGYVYQFDKGTSFSGQAIDAFMVLVFNHVKSPRVLKRYRKAVVEVAGDGYADFWMSADLGYGNTEYAPITAQQIATSLTAGHWDTGTWDNGVWDGRILAPSEFGLNGSAENISLRFAQSSDSQASLTFFSVMTAYTPRRLLR